MVERRFTRRPAVALRPVVASRFLGAALGLMSLVPGCGRVVVDRGVGTTDAGGGGVDAVDGDGGMSGTALRTAIATNSHVVVPQLTVPADFTMEIWVNPDSVGGADQLLLTKEQAREGANQFRLALTGGRVYFMMSDAARAGDLWTPDAGYRLISPAPVTAGAWTHVAVTKSGTQLALYLDGVGQAKFTTPTSLIHTGKHPFEIGARIGGDANFGGVLDEIRVWSVARSGDEIAADKSKTIPRSHPAYSSLLAYYKLDDAAGTVATDSTGEFPGTLVNGPQWVPSTAPTGRRRRPVTDR